MRFCSNKVDFSGLQFEVALYFCLGCNEYDDVLQFTGWSYWRPELNFKFVKRVPDCIFSYGLPYLSLLVSSVMSHCSCD